jgi:hypothetical protein
VTIGVPPLTFSLVLRRTLPLARCEFSVEKCGVTCGMGSSIHPLAGVPGDTRTTSDYRSGIRS